MARVTGPLMSIEASGTYAKTLVYAKWKGRSYCRERVIPNNPRSALQTAVRAMMAYASNRWASIPALDQASWEEGALALEISPFNLFVKTALDRWQLTEAPSDNATPGAGGGDLVIGTITRTGNEGYATLGGTPNVTTAADAVGVVILRSTAEITAISWANAIAIIPVTPDEAWLYTDSPLAAGTYHYRFAYISAEGELGTADADDTAVVT